MAESQSKVNGAAVAAEGGGGPVGVKFSLLAPHLMVEAPKAAEAIGFYKKAFGAQEVSKSYHKRKAEQELPLILHAHLKLGDFDLMLCDETDDAGVEVKSPLSLKGTSMILHLETEDLEAAFKRAVEAGASVTEGIADRSWGQRYGKLKDPYGFVWSIATTSAKVHADTANPAIADSEQS